MIVVDANVVVYLAVDGVFTETAQALAELDSLWYVPTLCRYELAKVLTFYVRNGHRSLDDVAGLWEDMSSTFRGREMEVDILGVIHLAEENQLSAYDAHYAFLSSLMEIPLVTEDVKLRLRCENAYSMQAYLQLRGA